MLSSCPPFARRAIGAFAAFAALVSSVTDPAAAWETAHGKPVNTGFEDVATAPAKTPRMVGNIGTIARGAGPVVASDGTVYLGNEQGKLMSFKPDGTPGWSREVGPGQVIVASPAIGSDGTIYVVSMKQSTDDGAQPTAKRVDTTLHRFNSTGGYLGQTIFPDHNGGAFTTASPNLWRFNGIELMLIPAVYKRAAGGGVDIRLLAFSTSGAIVADQRATSLTPETTGGAGLPSWVVPTCLIPFVTPYCYLPGGTDFEGAGSAQLPPPFPGVGLHTNPLGGTPWILLSDHYKDLVVFTLSGSTFYEAFRVHDDSRFMRSAPSITADQHSIVGAEAIKRSNNGDQSAAGKGAVVFSGPNGAKQPPVTGLDPIYATPTRLPDGRTILVGAFGQLAVLDGNQIAAKMSLPSGSIASVAASRTHLFVSTETSFQTFDPATVTEVARLDWSGGGESPPVIGPQGQVYAIADDTLFVFARPIGFSNANGTGGGPVIFGGGVYQDSGNQAPPASPQPTPRSQAYNPPLTANGNRLFACEQLDGDDCGKGDYRSIAKTFCAKNGFADADSIDVDSKKVKAETLDGQYCTKKKCKVFDAIVCKM